MKRTETIRKILGALDEFEGVGRDRWGRAEWTGRVLTALCGVGRELGYTVCASGVPGADWEEWLYDVCWLDGKQGLKSVPMVAECEWGHVDSIEAEFHKLLVPRASLRVMVCDGWPQPGGDDSSGRAAVERFGQHVRRFKGSRVDDTYLLIVYEWQEERRRSRRYRMRVNVRGKLPTVERL